MITRASGPPPATKGEGRVMTWALDFRKITRQVCTRWAENRLGAGEPGVRETDPDMARIVLAK